MLIHHERAAATATATTTWAEYSSHASCHVVYKYSSRPSAFSSVRRTDWRKKIRAINHSRSHSATILLLSVTLPSTDRVSAAEIGDSSLFRRPCPIRYHFVPSVDGVALVDHVKTPGVILQNALSFDLHVTESLLKQCSQRVYLLRLLRSQGLSAEHLIWSILLVWTLIIIV